MRPVECQGRLLYCYAEHVVLLSLLRALVGASSSPCMNKQPTKTTGQLRIWEGKSEPAQGLQHSIGRVGGQQGLEERE